MKRRAQIQIRGIVQGVGFRPFVYALAKKNSLKGRVLNNEIGVLVDVEGGARPIERFTAALRSHAPPLAVIESIETHDPKILANFKDFRIVESKANRTARNSCRFPPTSRPVPIACASCSIRPA